jgi:hypothetical protein
MITPNYSKCKKIKQKRKWAAARNPASRGGTFFSISLFPEGKGNRLLFARSKITS